eukprot:TRINITY_DN26526_c0_g1_i2.p1 TRINITY_DN26526_c0_g1~~TRINITY_DN26526_c0_g1_i2.p1  ORF type:complete len:228 (-),score=63.36 TRINITY_DN26526_c0_g1_i2:405-1088(-)
MMKWTLLLLTAVLLQGAAAASSEEKDAEGSAIMSDDSLDPQTMDMGGMANDVEKDNEVEDHGRKGARGRGRPRAAGKQQLQQIHQQQLLLNMLLQLVRILKVMQQNNRNSYSLPTKKKSKNGRIWYTLPTKRGAPDVGEEAGTDPVTSDVPEGRPAAVDTMTCQELTLLGLLPDGGATVPSQVIKAHVQRLDANQNDALEEEEMENFMKTMGMFKSCMDQAVKKNAM